MAITASARISEVWQGGKRHFVVEVVDANGRRVAEPMFQYQTRKEAEKHLARMRAAAA